MSPPPPSGCLLSPLGLFFFFFAETVNPFRMTEYSFAISTILKVLFFMFLKGCIQLALVTCGLGPRGFDSPWMPTPHLKGPRLPPRRVRNALPVFSENQECFFQASGRCSEAWGSPRLRTLAGHNWKVLPSCLGSSLRAQS